MLKSLLMLVYDHLHWLLPVKDEIQGKILSLEINYCNITGILAYDHSFSVCTLTFPYAHNMNTMLLVS